MADKIQNEIPKRFQSTGLNSDFHYENLTFTEYVSTMREIIEKSRVDLKPDNAEQIIDANSPYEWIPEAKDARNEKTGKINNGVLLIHGLFDSPYTLQSIADYFIKRNFLVRSVLLPGHGTIPGDLLNVSYNEWLKVTKYGAASFKNEVENLYLCGFSTGALLALLYAYENPHIKGLILFSPAIKLQQQFAIITSINHLMSRTIGGIKWYSRTEYDDYAKYHSFTFNSAHQVYLLTKILALHHRALKIPIFIAMSADDEILSPEGTIDYFKTLPQIENRLIIYTNSPTNNNDPRIICLKSAYPEKKIIDFSHICIAIAPDHPHYGEQGDFRDFLHYVRPYTKYYAKKDREKDEVVMGAVSHDNLKKYNLMRLSYNPDFYPLMARVDEFLESIQN